MPMIDQPEVGVLAFLVREVEDGAISWLLQAKTEPGTVGKTQIAPSIQATFSNHHQLHGGAPTLFLDLLKNRGVRISDTAQSEQGSGFLWKFNRNIVHALPGESHLDIDSRFLWVGSRYLRDALGLSYTVNTDARSVIASSEWALLGQRGESLFQAPVLRRSYGPDGVQQAVGVRRLVGRKQRSCWTFVPVDEMPGWDLTETELSHQVKTQSVRFFDVSTSDREVAQWCQPLLANDAVQECVIFMRASKGIAEFWIREIWEAGFGHRVEFGPSIQSSVATPSLIQAQRERDDVNELVAIEQSDEGSRFAEVKTVYRVLWTPSADLPDRGRTDVRGAWVSLRTLERLSSRSGAVNNELRTLVSLLLSTQMDEAASAV